MGASLIDYQYGLHGISIQFKKPDSELDRYSDSEIHKKPSGFRKYNDKVNFSTSHFSIVYNLSKNCRDEYGMNIPTYPSERRFIKLIGISESDAFDETLYGLYYSKQIRDKDFEIEYVCDSGRHPGYIIGKIVQKNGILTRNGMVKSKDIIFHHAAFSKDVCNLVIFGKCDKFEEQIRGVYKSFLSYDEYQFIDGDI
jgi:hypothetical protein